MALLGDLREMKRVNDQFPKVDQMKIKPWPGPATSHRRRPVFFARLVRSTGWPRLATRRGPTARASVDRRTADVVTPTGATLTPTALFPSALAGDIARLFDCSLAFVLHVVPKPGVTRLTFSRIERRL
jgi:hypothetical protein